MGLQRPAKPTPELPEYGEGNDGQFLTVAEAGEILQWSTVSGVPEVNVNTDPGKVLTAYYGEPGVRWDRLSNLTVSGNPPPYPASIQVVDTSSGSIQTALFVYGDSPSGWNREIDAITDSIALGRHSNVLVLNDAVFDGPLLNTRAGASCYGSLLTLSCAHLGVFKTGVFRQEEFALASVSTNAIFSVTKDTASKINVYVENDGVVGHRFRVQNKTGASIGIRNLGLIAM